MHTTGGLQGPPVFATGFAMNRSPLIQFFDTIDAFIYEHGFYLYMVFLVLSLVTIGLILARNTIRSHPIDSASRRPPAPPRVTRQPPVLPRPEPRGDGKPKMVEDFL